LAAAAGDPVIEFLLSSAPALILLTATTFVSLRLAVFKGKQGTREQ
jgi:hypothetical protein